MFISQRTEIKIPRSGNSYHRSWAWKIPTAGPCISINTRWCQYNIPRCTHQILQMQTSKTSSTCTSINYNKAQHIHCQIKTSSRSRLCEAKASSLQTTHENKDVMESSSHSASKISPSTTLSTNGYYRGVGWTSPRNNIWHTWKGNHWGVGWTSPQWNKIK